MHLVGKSLPIHGGVEALDEFGRAIFPVAVESDSGRGVYIFMTWCAIRSPQTGKGFTRPYMSL